MSIHDFIYEYTTYGYNDVHRVIGSHFSVYGDLTIPDFKVSTEISMKGV